MVYGEHIYIYIPISYSYYIHSCNHSCYPLVMTNIAIENGDFIVDFPIENSDFP